MDRGAWRDSPWGCKESDMTGQQIFQFTTLGARKPAHACSAHWQDPFSVETSWEVFLQHLKVPRVCKKRRAGEQHPASRPRAL